MPIPSPIITQESSLVSIVIETSASTEPISEFDEDILISLEDYYYSNSNKAVVKKGKNRTRDQSGMDVSVTDQIV